LDPVTIFTGFPLALHTAAQRCQPWRFPMGLFADVRDRPFAVVSDLHGPATFLPGSLSMPHLRGARSKSMACRL
jgi:hypothetical protein